MSGPDDLAALGLAQDPIAHPLAYPGRPPHGSGLLDGDRFLAVRERAGAPPGDWPLEDGVTLDGALRSRGRPVLAERHPVLAVGSNGSPAQLRRKLADHDDALVPMTYAVVRGLAPGVSAHVSRPGYIPAAPVLVPGAAARLVLVWLDDAQAEVIDRTEPNYRRVPLPAAATVSPDGIGSTVYAGRHGCLADRHGRPFRLAGQAELLAALLADLPGLGRLAGTADPAEFAARTRADEHLREAVRALWRSEGRVLHQAALAARTPG